MFEESEIQKAIFDNSPDGIVLVSPEHKILAYNKTIKFKLPYFSGREYEIGSDYRDLINPDHTELYMSTFNRALNGENVIVVAETKSETFSTWFEYRLNPVYTSSQELIGVSIIVKNIDKERRLEMEMEKLTETAKAIFENTTDSIVIIDKNFLILNFNKAAFNRVKKYGNKELVFGADFRDYIYEKTESIFMDTYNKALNGEITSTEVEIFDAHGNPFWIETRFQPIYRQSGELLGVGIFNQHITERKLAEREVEKLTETTKAIFENTTESIVIIDKNFAIVTFNKTAFDRVKKFGNKELMVGGDFRDFIYKSNDKTFFERYNKALNGEITTTEVEMIDSKGNPFWVQARHQPIYMQNGELLGVGIFSQHITERKLAEKEVEKLTEMITTIYNNTYESIVLISPDLKVLNFNKVMQQRTKERANKEIFIGADARDFMYNRSDVFIKMFRQALKGKASYEEVEAKDFTGNKFWARINMQPTYKKNGELLGIALFGAPITERKLAEIALLENEEKFKKIVESTPTPIVIADENLNIILVNAETEKVFGYKSEELLGKGIRTLIPKKKLKNPNGKNQPQDRLFYGSGSKIISVTKNGVPIIIENSVKTFYLNNKKYIVSIILDVTQRVKNEEQIANQIKRLQAIAWQQSHEIRRPLSNILGVFDLLQLQKNTSIEEMQKYLEYIHESAKELDQIIHNIVDYTS